MLELLKKIWKALSPADPYFHIASAMELEGYTEDEIQAEIERLKDKHWRDSQW